MLVFVYGTLKSGEPNHYVLQNGGKGLQELKLDNFQAAQFVSKGKTIQKYPLVIASKWNIPYLLDKKNTGNEIQGEIYSVNQTLLAILDDFEGHPGYYCRRQEPIQVEEKKPPLNCWTYFLPKFKEKMLELPFLSDYKSLGDHGKPYCSEEDTDNIEDIEIE